LLARDQLAQLPPGFIKTQLRKVEEGLKWKYAGHVRKGFNER
jgi:hypothetical protein